MVHSEAKRNNHGRIINGHRFLTEKKKNKRVNYNNIITSVNFIRFIYSFCTRSSHPVIRMR